MASGITFGVGENFGEVNGSHPGLQAVQATADVHQAGVVPGGADFGFGVADVTHFVGEHGGTGLGVLDGERATEAAALVGILERDASLERCARV
jgi:hypothetical protein